MSAVMTGGGTVEDRDLESLVNSNDEQSTKLQSQLG
jgi:hypothetical protein